MKKRIAVYAILVVVAFIVKETFAPKAYADPVSDGSLSEGDWFAQMADARPQTDILQ